MKTIPAALQAAVLAAQTNEVALVFLTITHADLAAPIYLVNNTEAVTRGGNVHSPFSFFPVLPTEKDGEIGSARITIDAVDLSIITAIRSIETPATVSLAVALASDPDNADIELGEFQWKALVWDKSTVSGDLTYEDRLDVNVPAGSFTPVTVPGVF